MDTLSELWLALVSMDSSQPPVMPTLPVSLKGNLATTSLIYCAYKDMCYLYQKILPGVRCGGSAGIYCCYAHMT